VPRTRLSAILRIALLGAMAFACPAAAQQARSAGPLGEIPLPGGLHAAMQAVGDPAAADRSQFLLEFIRRVYSAPTGGPDDAGAAPLQSLLAFLDRSTAGRGDTDPDGDSRETLPLGLPTSVWLDVVFGGHATPRGLLSAILQSRNAALLYYGVLSLDDDTRAWLAGEPEIVADVASRRAAAFVLAAPALRVIGGVVRVPGGPSAEASWAALTGARVDDPAAFVRALLTRDDGHLAYLFGALAALTAPQVRLVLHLDAEDTRERVAAAHRLLATFRRIVLGWDIQQRTFWRPAMDPALLAGDLRVDAGGRPVLPGTRRFWTLVFDGTAPGDTDADPATLTGPPVEFWWLCEQVFSAPLNEAPRRYRAVLFASRIDLTLSPATARDAVDAVRAAWEYPALTAAIERARVHDPAVLARAARRARQLSSIGKVPRAVRSITQFQGALAILARAVSRRSIAPDRFADLLSSLSAIDPDGRGDYDGALVRWVDSQLGHTAAGLDDELLELVAGAAPAEPRLVEWEGTRYHVDVARSEAIRVARLLGEGARPYVSSAAKLVKLADALAGAGLVRARLRDHVTELSAIGRAVGWAAAGDWAGDVPQRYDTVAEALGRAARAGDVNGARALAPPLLVLSDDLLARGLLELTYAAALGQPERTWVRAADVATRHSFDIRPGASRTAAWELPAMTAGLRSGFAVTGSLLGLDAGLAELALVRVSSRPPPRRPTIRDMDRRGFIQAVTIVEPAWLTDADLERLVAAIKTGRARVAALRSARDAFALAQELRFSPARASLLAWMVAHEPARVPAFFSPGELLLSGLGDAAEDGTLDGWGAPALARVGCLCLRLPRREPGEAIAGRWGSGMFVSAFPDLNLRLAELLADMQMPAALLGPVLASATLDFVNGAVSRDEDDRRGLLEFVQGLDRTSLEQYLALLTTDGPLVPIDDAIDAADAAPATQAGP
jgi:hypothetical protein